jgi:lysophospholipase L1-like esterase
MMKTWVFRLGAGCISLMLGLASAEVFIRLHNHALPARTALSIHVEPSGKHMYQPDERLGYTLVPHQRLTVTLDKVGKFVATTTDCGHRATSQKTDCKSTKPQIWIFGCSYTFGWVLNDQESYPWRLQALLPEYDIVNFGTSGYSTLQSLIQLENEVREGKKPRLAILAYLTFHDERNTLAPLRSKILGFMWRDWGEVNQPYAVMRPDGKLERRKSEPYRPYVPWVQYSAFANYLDWTIVRHLERRAIGDDQRTAITRELVREFIGLGRANGFPTLIADLNGKPSDIASVANAEGAPFVHIGVQYKDPEMTIPHDIHPTAKADMIMADRLDKFLKSILNHS